MTKVFSRLLIAITFALLIGSCATPILPTELVPADDKVFQSTGKTITVLPVRIWQRFKPGWQHSGENFPDAEIYKNAVISTLAKSRLFTEVKNEGKADYSLSIEVIGERILGVYSNVAFILVRYELTEAETKSTIWNENIFSHFGMSVSDEFLGTKRLAKTTEGVIRNNMELLKDKLAHVLVAQGS